MSINLNSEYPAKKMIEHFAEELFEFLFPILKGKNNLPFDDVEKLQDLKNQLNYLIFPQLNKSGLTINEIVKSFFVELPIIYEELKTDATQILESDPAANSCDEIYMAYPGFYAVSIYRFAHSLGKLKVKLLPRVITEFAHSKTGIDIHPEAKIGKSFFIDHGTGVVIGQTAIIGDRVKIFQGVTLGALSVEKTFANLKRHPTIEENVVIYSGATILGGETIIGKNTVIGGNVWVTESVPANSLVYHKSDTRIRTKQEQITIIDFSI